MLTNFHCKICRSEVCEPIEDFLKNKESFRAIAKEFKSYFDCSFHALEQAVSRHFKKHFERKLSYEELIYLENIRRGEVDPGEVAEHMEYLLKHERV